MGIHAEVWVRQGAQLERKGKKSFFCHNFDQVVVVAYYWPRGNRPDQVIFRANEMIFTFFLFQFHSEVTPHVAPGEAPTGSEIIVKTQN